MQCNSMLFALWQFFLAKKCTVKSKISNQGDRVSMSIRKLFF